MIHAPWAMRRDGDGFDGRSIKSHNVGVVTMGRRITGTINWYVWVNTSTSSRLLVNSRWTSKGGFLPRLVPSMTCPFSRVTRRNSLTTRGLRRLLSRATPGTQPAAGDYSFYRQAAFANIVHAVKDANCEGGLASFGF